MNVQAPYEIAGKPRTMALVSYARWASAWIPLDVVAGDPGLYVALNFENALRNTVATPARPGSAVVLCGTGQGTIASPAVPTGVAAPLSLLSEVRDVAATGAGEPARVPWAGLTPGSIGLLQINVELPAGAATGERYVLGGSSIR